MRRVTKPMPRRKSRDLPLKTRATRKTNFDPVISAGEVSIGQLLQSMLRIRSEVDQNTAKIESLVNELQEVKRESRGRDENQLFTKDVQDSNQIPFTAIIRSVHRVPVTDLPKPITLAIDESKQLLELEPDWDENGAEPVSREAWNRAVAFLEKTARILLERNGTTLPAPRIVPGPKDSVDLHWDESDFELLINFPGNSTIVTFYGDDKRITTTIKGSFDPNVYNEGLLLWLAKNP